MKRILCALLCLCLLLTACGTPQDDTAPSQPEQSTTPASEEEAEESSSPAAFPTQITSLDQLLEVVRQNHLRIVKPEVDLSDYILGAADAEYNLFDYTMGEEYVADAPLTLQQAEEDLDVLFGILRSTYGMYFTLGGDEVFLAAKEEILAGCRTLDEEELLSAGALEELLLTHMQFVYDGHFRFNGQATNDTLLAHVYTELAFQPQDGVFVSEDGKVVASVDGYESPDEVFRLSIAESGELVYYPVVLSADWEPAPLTVRWDDGSERAMHAPEWQSHYEQSERWVDVQYNGSIPVVFARSMGYDGAPNDTGMGLELLATAEQLRDESVVMFDLRSNQGGNGLLPIKWLMSWMGEQVPTNFVTLNYMSDEDLVQYGENLDNPTRIPYEEMVGIGGWQPLTDEYMAAYTQPDRFVPNDDRLLVLLTGKNTSSAAEIMVDVAHNLDNTLIVGSNTLGTLISNAYIVVYLPHSHISTQLGSMLSVFPDDYFEEFVGFQPDIWVAGDAEELVVKMLAYYA